MSKKIWDNLAYISLGLCVLGNVAVGYWYIFAQTAYLIANTINFTRDCVLGYSTADKVRDMSFLGITIGLILIRKAVIV